ncbi:MAG TPA: hypothetical protein VKT51_02645 [Candidatus Eremiobacteraceae bacterium]|nr:hypothetical protein [Candidatus Eremiobacteraceae bacterium]
MKDVRREPGLSPTDVPPKPHEFPEYEDMPTDVHDDTGPERKQEADNERKRRDEKPADGGSADTGE